MGRHKSLGAKSPAGECGGKDQVRRADSLIFVEVKHKESDCTVEYHGANPTLCYYLINSVFKGACTAQNYVKLLISMSQNIADSGISDVTHACLFDVDVAIGGIEVGVAHAGSDELAFDACSV